MQIAIQVVHHILQTGVTSKATFLAKKVIGKSQNPGGEPSMEGQTLYIALDSLLKCLCETIPDDSDRILAFFLSDRV